MAGGSSRWQLSIVGPDGGKRSVPLGRDVVVGRDRDVDLRLDDQSVSRKHAKLYFDETGGLWVEDLGSGNGVILAGARVKEATEVPSGAPLKLGVFTLTARDAKAGSAGQEIVKGKPGEAAKNAVASVKAAQPQGPPPPVGCALRGKAGSFLNKDFPLQKPVVNVGRVQDGNDIAISDDTLSRQHARLTRHGRGYVLRDLGSANGTSVNGERILEKPLEEGDVVRFGTVEFDYFGPPPMVAQPLDPRRKKLLVVGAASVGVLLLVLFIAQATKKVDVENTVAQTSATEDAIAQAERHVGVAQDARRDEQWDRARSEYEQAIKLDPINLDARKGLKEVEREMDMKQFMDKAKQRVDVGQEEAGVDLYLKVDSSSVYFPRAQAEIQRLASLLERRYHEGCHTAEKAGEPAAIVENCGHYMNLICNSRADEATLKQLRNAERRLGSKLGAPWACQASYASWGGSQSVDAASLDSRVAQKYKDQRVAENVRIYANGQAKTALSSLNNMMEMPAYAHNADVKKLANDIGLALGVYQDGLSALEQSNTRQARDSFQQLVDVDKRIMPDGFEGQLVVDLRQQLAHQYYKIGNGFFSQARWSDAYAQFDQGFQIKPGDADLQEGFKQLEDAAYKIVNNPQNCGDLRTVLSMTRGGDNPSFSHKEAMRIGKEQKCKGF